MTNAIRAALTAAVACSTALIAPAIFVAQPVNSLAWWLSMFLPYGVVGLASAVAGLLLLLAGIAIPAGCVYLIWRTAK